MLVWNLVVYCSQCNLNNRQKVKDPKPVLSGCTINSSAARQGCKEVTMGSVWSVVVGEMAATGGLVLVLVLVLPALALPQEPLSSAVNFPASSLEARAASFVERAESELEASAGKLTFASWNYQSNLTDANQAISLAVREKHGILKKTLGKEAQGFDASQVQDKDVKRKLTLMKNIGTSALPDDKLQKFNKLVADMGSTYSKAKVSLAKLLNWTTAIIIQ